MKILLAGNCETTFDKIYLTQIAHTLQKGGIEVVICGEDLHIPSTKVYPAFAIHKPWFTMHLDNRSYEEYMYSSGYLNEKFLDQDVALVHEIIEKENIELVIGYDRPGAILASYLDNIKQWVLVSQGMYRNFYFSPKVLTGFNRVCSVYNYPQQLSLASFYAKASRCIGLGGVSSSVFDDQNTVCRIGTLRFDEIRFMSENSICVYLDGMHAHRQESVLKEAFVGAKHRFLVYGAKEEEYIDNMMFLKNIDLESSLHASFVIHAGSEYMTQYLLSHGIPQCIVSDHTCKRGANASLVERCHLGIRIYEEEMNVKRLYEGYRKMIQDTLYKECSEHLSQDAKNNGNLKQLVDFAFIDLISSTNRVERGN